MKEALLAKSNFKKKKSSSITIFLLMLLSAFLIGISMLLFLDAFPNTNKYAEKLNAPDGYTILYNDITNIDDKVIDDILKDNVKEYFTYEYLFYPVTPVPFNNGDLVTNLLISNKNVFNKTMDKTEIAMEDTSVKENYIYVPYQFYSNGTAKLKDIYEFSLNGRKYEFTIKGFTNTVSFGCNTAGSFEFILDDESYLELEAIDLGNKSLLISYNLDDITPGRMDLIIRGEIAKVNHNTLASSGDLESVIFNRGYMALILGLSFLVVTIISTIVIILMLANSIMNYIKENMKQIGALKALGYTSKNIILSLLIQFITLAIAAVVLGAILSYAFMPIFASIISIQQGFSYAPSFNILATLIPTITIILLTLIVVLLSTRKIHKINPIVALREGLDSHNFKKNRIPLDKSKLNLNISLAFKTLFNNIKQNIITFIVVGFLMFICGVGVMMYENFSRNPKIDILAFESCGGVITVDNETKDSLYNYLESRNDLTNIRSIINIEVIYGDNLDRLMTYIVDDSEKLNNKNVCYQGRLAKYDNETCISGKFASKNNISIGDMVELSYLGTTHSYLVTGLLQSCNNNGKEAFLTKAAAAHLYDFSLGDEYYWFDATKEDTIIILDDVVEIYGSHILTTMNFYSVVEGGLEMFKLIATFMMLAMIVISSIVILLVLYLLIKTLLHNKKNEYGILKALGYTSGSLIFQTAVSFMPSIILSVIVFGIVSYFTINPYMNLIMINFGLMKCEFVIPVIGIIGIGLLLILISFLFAIFESRKIKKIEPYNLLICE